LADAFQTDGLASDVVIKQVKFYQLHRYKGNILDLFVSINKKKIEQLCTLNVAME